MIILEILLGLKSRLENVLCWRTMLTLQGCMIMRITQILLSAEEPSGFIITFQSVLYFSNLSCYKQRQLNLLIYDGNQYHSSFCMLPRAVSHH